MNISLLRELADLNDSAYMERLRALRDETVQNWTSSDDPRVDPILKGEKRILDRLISEIETAYEKLARQRQREGAALSQSEMSKAF